MQKFHRNITLERLDKFIDNNSSFKDVGLMSCLYKEKSEDSIQLKCYQVPDNARISFLDAKKQQFKPAKKGDSFGPSWATVWFQISIKIPQNLSNQTIHFIWDCENEGLIYTKDGHPMQGLTGGNGWDRRANYLLTKKAESGEVFEFYLEMACNGMFGVGDGNMINPPEMNRRFTLKQCEICSVNEGAFDLVNDFEIIKSLARELEDDGQFSNDAMVCANSIVNAFDPNRKEESVEECLKLSKKFFQSQKSDIPHSITVIGHCHIDSCWLWPYDETKRKCARSWATQIRLMEKYDDYKFACSQAQQYEWVQNGYPSLFEELKKYVAKGQFIPIGGTWVEMDCNLPTGESFVRQFLFGIRFYEKNFNVSPQVFWLPDTFGYAAQLPQIVKESGMKYFLTQKLSWNNINKFPNNTFYWVGLDGSKVLTHFPPADSYTSQGQVYEIVKCLKNNKDKCYSNESMFVYGNGDGGGGPTVEMIERLKRMENTGGLAKVKHDHPDNFFDRVEKNNGVNNSGGLKEWKGELYFELHRGTYTSQAKMKWFNRKLEFMLRDVEILFCGLDLSVYPKEALDRCWKILLLNQFHDALPGSSIEMVYKDMEVMYTDIEKTLMDLKEKAFEDVLQKCFLNHKQVTDGKEGKDLNNIDPIYVASETIELFEVCCSGFYNNMMKNLLNKFKKADLSLSTFNSLSFARNEVIEVEVPEGISAKDLCFAQTTANNKGLVIVEAKPFAVQTHGLKKDNVVSVEIKAVGNRFVLENYYVRVMFNEQGRLVSYYDKVCQRDIVPEGSFGNVFRMYDDIPLYWDAWDVEVYHLEKPLHAGEGKASIYEKGPVRASLLLEHIISPRSKIRQIISLTSISPRLDFVTEVDWNENRKFLKVEFPVSIQSDFATYETAYGWVQRPTHYNTSWDLAKFEVCGHKFADFSEYGYGVALLNDCKYGYAVHDNVMRLSLLRSPKAPDANCDIGHHQFKYALFPHKGTFAESSVVYEGLKFNVGLMSRLVPKPDNTSLNSSSSGLNSAILSGPIFQSSAPNVIIDCVKKAEDSKGIIVRMYEAYGGRCSFKFSSTLAGVKTVYEVNLMEKEKRSVQVNGGHDGFYCNLEIKPFQILSLKIKA